MNGMIPLRWNKGHATRSGTDAAICHQYILQSNTNGYRDEHHMLPKCLLTDRKFVAAVPIKFCSTPAHTANFYADN